MESVGSLLPRSEVLEKAVQTLKFKNRWLNQGFTHVSNHLIRDTSVSANARLMYILLMSRAFQKDFSYPGEETLAKEMDVSVPSIISYKKELASNGWLQVIRRGQGKTNVYYLKKF